MSGELERRFVECAFFVLDLALDASRTDVERTAQRLLAELAIGRAAAKTYRTPLGDRTRTDSLVRTAAAELRDPHKRLVHEAWARLAGRAEPGPAAPAASRAHPGLLAALGLGRP